MGHMKDLYIQIRNMGINPEIVDLEKVQDYQALYWQETGGILSTVEAIEHMYGYTDEDAKYTHTARKDWERSVYEQCDREDREEMSRGI